MAVGLKTVSVESVGRLGLASVSRTPDTSEHHVMQGQPGNIGAIKETMVLSSRPVGGVQLSAREAVEDEEEDEDEEWEDLDETWLYLRSKFFESWLWMDVKLPNQPDRDG